MKANRAFHLIVSRESHEPAFLADPDRLDRVEVISIDDGEVVLYWDLQVREATKLARSLKTDLATLDEAAFIDKWVGRDAGLDEQG
jgi:hypothetical protein